MFSLIAAMDLNRGIGIRGGLPWRLKKDTRFFQALTTARNPMEAVKEHGILPTSGMPESALAQTAKQPDGSGQNAVIMGRKTWDSLPERFRPLPGRTNIILSRSLPRYPAPGTSICSSFADALASALKSGSPHVYVIGGAMIYAAALAHPQCSRAYLTEIQDKFECDASFPELPAAYREIGRSDVYRENGVSLIFKIFGNREIVPPGA